ncbi:MAG: hypothetical protein HC934_09440 [Acaryochloridaceae cyanobacterium SU_2_1]|nr:hypothetical protein [Acaryochloridaceae cyanobacterium SU_2_1]
MFTSAETNRLIAEIGQLRSQVEHLRQRNLDLEISLSTISEHGDYIQAQLQDEIAERRRTENSLSKLLSLISSEKEDLEILLQTLTEHSDAIDSHWHQKLDEAFAWQIKMV